MSPFRGNRLRGSGVRTSRLLVVGLTAITPACASARSATSETGANGAVPTIVEGRTVFLDLTEPRCGVCHTLSEAGSTGTLGPNLDELRPDAGRVIAAVTQGVGAMGAQDHLTDAQIEALAAYVSQMAGGTDR